MEEGADVMYWAVIKQPSINMISVWTIVSEKNVLNLVVVTMLLVKLISAAVTEEAEDVKNQIVKKVL
jgi:hypothetical protein